MGVVWEAGLGVPMTGPEKFHQPDLLDDRNGWTENRLFLLLSITPFDYPPTGVLNISPILSEISIFLSPLGLIFRETSAKTAQNVEEVW